MSNVRSSRVLLSVVLVSVVLLSNVSAQERVSLKPLSELQAQPQQTPAPNLENGQPAYKMVGRDTLVNPKLLFDPELSKQFRRRSQASQTAEEKARTAKVDLSAAIAIIQQNGALSGGNQQLVAALRESENTIGELETLTQQIEAERVARSVEAGEQNEIAEQYYTKLQEVEERSRELAEEAANLETRELFFSTGFYASLAAIGMGVVGVFLQLPTVLLDRQLKRLELIKLRKEIDAVESGESSGDYPQSSGKPAIAPATQIARPTKRQAA